jgi:hypothetical protein
MAIACSSESSGNDSEFNELTGANFCTDRRQLLLIEQAASRSGFDPASIFRGSS